MRCRLLVVFLCLAALYESWSVPAAVMAVVPLGIFGALVASTLLKLSNDIYFQVGLLTTMGSSREKRHFNCRVCQRRDCNKA